MNTTFENELRKVFDKVSNLENKKYVGRAFYASIDKDIKLKAEFISTETHDKFDAMKIRVLHKGEGELDTNTIRLKEIWGNRSGTEIFQTVFRRICGFITVGSNGMHILPTPLIMLNLQIGLQTMRKYFRTKICIWK